MSIRPAVSALLVVALVLLAAVPDLRAQSRQLSATERVGTLRTAAPRTTSGPVSAEPPALPPGFEAETEDRQLSAPIRDDGLAIPPAQTVETAGGALNQPQAPGTFVIVRDTVLTPPITSRVNEPSVGSQAQGIFTTHNWYAEISTNNGGSFSYVNPFSLFPASPTAFSGGFCCDQRVAQDSKRNLIFWYLQYIKTGTAPTSTNGVRLAVTHGQAGLAGNTWQSYDFTPAQFGLSGKWLDYPNLQASANDLYFTTNIFETTNDAFYGALVVRIPLAQLDAGSALTIDYYLTTSFGSILAVNGAAAEGTRPGRTTMYFAAVYTSTSLKVLTWPEANPAPTVSDVSGLATTNFASVYTCPGPDALDPCTRANARAQAGWITSSELGIMWTSAQNGAPRPYPYVRTAILNPGTLAVLSQPDIFSSTSAWLYPAVAVNERGDLGGVVDNLGGNVLPTIRALIRDGYSADPSVSGWETYSVATSTNGTSGLWGDFNGAMPHEQFPRTWLGTGHAQSGGSGDGNSRPHNIWFGRQRDTAALGFYTATPCRVLDTRINGGPLVSGAPRAIQVGGTCGVPADAVAVSLNVTVVAPPAAGFVVLFPGDAAFPGTSTLNFGPGQTRANNAILEVSVTGALAGESVLAGGGQVDLIVDVNGYFK